MSRAPGARSRLRRGGESSGLLAATEVASFAVTASAIAGMHLLFSDGSFLGPLLLQVALAHAVIAGLRRMRVRLLPAALLTAGAALLCITWAQYLDTAIAVLPAPDTLSAIRSDMDGAWQLFRDVRAPAPVAPGFIVTTSMTIWVIVFISDWGAFRTGVSFEALLPQATLFLFAAVLGAEGGRASGAALFVGAALVFLLLHRTWRQEGTATWAALHRQRGRSSLLMSGSTLAVIAVVVGGIAGPKLPGAEDEAILPWKDFTQKKESRKVVSPLVDIQRRLVKQSEQEVFRVKVDDPTIEAPYWRLTALDVFDGRIWRSTYQTDDADGELPRSLETDNDTYRVEQTITVSDLGAIWLPAAFEPAALDTGESGDSVDYDPESATLIVDNDSPSSDGIQYTVESEIPRWTPEQLRGASERIPDDIEDRYLDLPDGFSPQITQQAQQVVSGSETRYDKALALMNFFRDGSFEYTLEVPPEWTDKHGEAALLDFLFETRAGYCEQFAGAYAAMARAADMPARVVVGFTSGQQEPTDRSEFRVTGKQAHAWVEVYFHGLGWVMFDPTPGRGPTNGDDYLGLEPEQELGGGAAAEQQPTEGQTAPDPAAPSGRPSSPVNRDEIESGAAADSAIEEKKDDSNPITDAAKGAGIVLGIGALAYLVVVGITLAAMAFLRRRRARSPSARVQWVWSLLTENVADAGLRLSPSLTVAETAGRVRTAYPSLGGEVDLVAGWIERVNYAEEPPSPEEADEALEAGTAVASAATRRLPTHLRLWRYFDARRLVPRTREARRSAHGAARTRLRDGD